MNARYDKVRISRFLAHPLDLKEFCFYFRNEVERESRVKRIDLDYGQLGGDNPSQRAQCLVDLVDQRGYLAELVFHLTNYWFDEFHGKQDIFLEAKMHHELCIAAQELWQTDRQRPRADIAFERLAQLDKEFGMEWRQARPALQKAPPLEPIRRIDEWTAHLAECRKRYAQATELREAHQWLRARAAFIELNQLQPGYADAPDWVRRLDNEDEVGRLQKIVDAARSGFVYDDRLPWEGVYPYRLSQQLGISVAPGSAMDEVQKELLQLDQQRAISPEQRAGLETLLRSEGERLFVDAFLYPIGLTKETAGSIEKTFLEEGRLPAQETVTIDDPDERAALLFLLERPDAAAAIWKAAQRRRPLESRLAHCQGLFYLGQAHVARDPQAAVENWRLAISHWAVALADTAYWVKWGRERSKAYGRPFVFTSVANLAPRLQHHLECLLQAARDRPAGDDGPAPGETIEQLRRELAIECAAVRLAQALGGIALEPGQLAWFGPLWMAQYSQEAAVARHIATVVPDEGLGELILGRLSPGEALRRLRWYFSYLRTAAILLEGPDPQPRRALEALESSVGQPLPSCGQEDCPVHGKSRFPVAVCCPHWDRFSLENPAYAGFENRQGQMCDDALHLAIEAHAQLARAQISNGEIADRNVLLSEWRELLALARSSRDPSVARERIRALVLEETKTPSPDVARLNSAIALLEVGLGVLSESDPRPEEQALKARLAEPGGPARRAEPPTWPEEQALKARLAELLVARGLARERRDNISGAEADLKRALAMVPHVHDIRVKLAVLWANQASKVVRYDRFLALDYLRQAIELIVEGKARYPGYDYSQLEKWIEESQQNLTYRGSAPPQTGGSAAGGGAAAAVGQPPLAGGVSKAAQLYGQGMREMREGRPGQALQTFGQALEAAPDDADTQAATAKALLARAWQLTDEGEHQQGLDLIEQWMPRLPAQAKRLERQVEFLKWWPHIQLCLKKKPELIHEVQDYQQLLLPFEAKNVDSVPVQVQVEGDNLCLTAPLPAFSEAEEESALGNLLLASRAMMLFKPARVRGSELVLKGLVPFRLLDPDWLFLTTFELSDFADISHDQILRIDPLRAWLRETQASYAQKIEDRDHQAESGRAVERLCRQRGLEPKRLTGFHYEAPTRFGIMEMEAWPDGARLAVCLGRLREASGRQKLFSRMVELNSGLRTGKLALDRDDKELVVVLSVELPYLDGQGAAEAFDLLEQKTAGLKSELVRPI